VHLFGYPARQGLSYVKDTIQTAIYDIGFVIEGATNGQLPEQILSCCRISKMGVSLCKTFPKELMQLNIEEQTQKQSNHANKQQEAKPSPSKSKSLSKSLSNLHLKLNEDKSNQNGKNGHAPLSKSQSTESLSEKGPNNAGWFSGIF